ncbi:MAG: UDP-N-acetylmuramoyl-tripeptide--D-alanyl-D-alanine ligase [Rhodocyclaceae bacterium]|nr:UDP-N-acetylmuramoyl-tripeptide--D-alanyl-D-alanine ligase [Rhodocyclaceae bacterium]
MMNLRQAALAVAGRVRGADAEFEAVSTDTRSIAAGDLFVALRGERFDGHDYLAVAAGQGAVAALVDEAWAGNHAEAPLPLVIADDTRLALGRLAAHWRADFEIPLVGVTGSNGKTTVKEMTAAILRAQARLDGADGEEAVLATQGNLNNDIGLPLTLLRLRGHHRAAVVEMGMNHPGEIAYLTKLAQPTVALVNNAQRAHLAGMGGLAEVAEEKGAIYGGLGPEGVAVVNGGDPYCAYWRGLNAGRSVLTFALDQPADVSGRFEAKGYASLVRVATPEGDTEFLLPLPGRHNVMNALAATAAALAACASLDAVAAGLSGFSGVKGRLQRKTALGGAVLLDDSYNANPDSVRAAIEVLAMTPGRTVLVLGDMGEIGERAGQLHDEIGGYAKSQGVDQLFGLGELAETAVHNFGNGGRHFRRVEDLVAALVPELDADTVVLVKGSRFMRMERVADAITAPKKD